MARIRTIKPEFWTDEKIVQLPYEARLLFIGMWNFADDDGLLIDEPDRLRMQVLPNDPIDADGTTDLLIAAGFVERWVHDDGSSILRLPHFAEHQKISHKTPSKLSLENSRKVQISLATRRAVATKYGCKPGKMLDAECYYCGAPGQIQWQRLYSGRPGAWVAFSRLELDHFEPEHKGGASSCENLVLACRECNRSKHTKNGIEFASRKFRKTPEPSSLEGKGKEEEVEGNLEGATSAPPRKDSHGPAKRGTRIDPDRQPDEQDRRFAEQHGHGDAWLAEQWPRYVNHHAAKGTVSKDWRASWRTWVLRAADFARAGGAASQGHRPPAGSVVAVVRELMSEADRADLV